eukprot:5159084-Pyramimonas_sp.AAC.1
MTDDEVENLRQLAEVLRERRGLSQAHEEEVAGGAWREGLARPVPGPARPPTPPMARPSAVEAPPGLGRMPEPGRPAKEEKGSTR